MARSKFDPHTKMDFGRRAQNTNKKVALTRKKMNRTVAKGGVPDGPIRVQLDAKTIVTMKPAMLDFWRQRYPALQVL